MEFILKEAYDPTTLNRNLNTSALTPFTPEPEIATRKPYTPKHDIIELSSGRTCSPYNRQT